MADPDPAPAAGVRLTCRPGKSGDALLFPYTLENRGPAAIYAMHAVPGFDRSGGGACADEHAGYVIAGEEGDAVVGKFAAPLPTDRRVAVPVFPLARLVPAGASLAGRLEIPLPLAETSPYFPDLTLRGYQITEIKGVRLTIGYWLDGADGLTAIPADYAPGLFNIVTRNTMRSARRAMQRFPTTGLQLFRRTDAFPRTLP